MKSDTHIVFSVKMPPKLFNQTIRPLPEMTKAFGDEHRQPRLLQDVLPQTITELLLLRYL